MEHSQTTSHIITVCKQTAKADIALAQKFKITSFIIENAICSELVLEEYFDSPENFTRFCLNPFSKGNNLYLDSKNNTHLKIIHLTFNYILTIYNLWKARRKKDESAEGK